MPSSIYTPYNDSKSSQVKLFASFPLHFFFLSFYITTIIFSSLEDCFRTVLNSKHFKAIKRFLVHAHEDYQTYLGEPAVRAGAS